MNWLILTILAILGRGTYSIASKMFSSAAKVAPTTQTVLLTFCAGVFAIIASPFIGGISFNGIVAVWPTALIMVLTQAFGGVFYFKGMQKLGAGMTQIAFSSILIWGAALSTIFLNSNFSYEQIFGVMLVMFAIVFSAYRKEHQKLGLSLLYIIFCALLFAIFQVTSAQLALTISTGAYLIMAYFGSAIAILIVYSKQVISDLKVLKHDKPLPVLWTACLSGLLTLFYFVSSYLAYASAPSRGVVVLLLSMQVMVSVILGIVLLKEKDNVGRKLVSALIAVVGAILINS